jgi:polyhydroxyalkanoate synthesis regulator phasin
MDTNEKQNNETEKTDEYPIYHMMHKMMLAGFGVLSILHEEFGQHIDKLVERGEIAEKNREEMLKKMKDRREMFLKNRKEFTNKHFAEAMEQFNVPNKTDIDGINQKIADLEKKIDDINKAKD